LSKREVLQLYEKLYFHEAESREKLNARLQMPLALIISLIGAVAFLLQNYEHKGLSGFAVAFGLLLSLAVVAILLAAYYFTRSWFNNTYSFLPAARDTEAYRQTLLETYRPYPDGEKLAADYFTDYLLNYYVERSSENTACNDRRSLYVHRTNAALIATAIIAFVAFLVFFFGGLQKGREPILDKMTATATEQPEINVSSDPKSNKTEPPPPPPPPPPRQIKEGVEIVPSKANTPAPQGGSKDGR
jgi:hypothetical protein